MIPPSSPVDLRLLRIFDVLLDELSVSRTAARLGLSQPAVSQALARLRQTFDDPLLLRSRQGMVATDRATVLARELRPLLLSLDRLVAPAGEFDPSTSRRSFVLTAPEYAEHLLLPDLVQRLRRQAPGVRLDIRQPDPARAVEQLERGEVDLRIAWTIKAQASLRSAPLWQDRIVCIADRDHPQIRGTLTLEQYLRLPHARPLGSGRTTTGQVIDAAVERLGGTLTVAVGVQNFLTLPRLVRGTDLIATVPRALALGLAAQHPVQVLEPPLPLPRVRYAAYWHERSHKDPGHRWLRQAVAEAARSLKQTHAALRSA